MSGIENKLGAALKAASGLAEQLTEIVYQIERDAIQVERQSAKMADIRVAFRTLLSVQVQLGVSSPQAKSAAIDLANLLDVEENEILAYLEATTQDDTSLSTEPKDSAKGISEGLAALAMVTSTTAAYQQLCKRASSTHAQLSKLVAEPIVNAVASLVSEGAQVYVCADYPANYHVHSLFELPWRTGTAADMQADVFSKSVLALTVPAIELISIRNGHGTVNCTQDSRIREHYLSNLELQYKEACPSFSGQVSGSSAASDAALAKFKTREALYRQAPDMQVLVFRTADQQYAYIGINSTDLAKLAQQVGVTTSQLLAIQFPSLSPI